jgi:endo-1,4-beta-D-glucanase Y
MRRTFGSALGLMLAACASAPAQAGLPARAPLPGAMRDSITSASSSAQLAGLRATPEQAALHAAQRSVISAERAIAPTPLAACPSWPLWQRYAEVFISDEGRVVDAAADARSTSEGQAYALFFALVAGDRARFERILRWTEDNLAAGNLASRLPAWHWGRHADGRFGVVDGNAASDADLWLAYALLEAARAWGQPVYHDLGLALAARVAREEVVSVPGLGAVLLPGPRGFQLEGGAVSLNPSYLVLPILRRIRHAGVPGAWGSLIASSVRVLDQAAPRGLAADWVSYVPGRGFVDDAKHGPFGSYDAIRVYLWSALLPQAEPEARALRRSARALAELVDRIGRVPERIQIQTAEVSEQNGPPGFLAVALASAQASGQRELAAELSTRLTRAQNNGLYGDVPAYYDQNLALFALGFVEGRYRFLADGRLQLSFRQGACEQ